MYNGLLEQNYKDVKNKMSIKNIKKKVKKYQWVIILAFGVLIAMWIYGMTEHYFPTPVHIGAGQYLDLATGIIIVSLLFAGIIIGILFKKKKKR